MSHDFLRRSHEIGASRARRKVLKKRSLKAAAAALGGDQAYERPSEGEGTSAREPRGAGEATARYGDG
jgi:hypothetical protein